MYGTFSDVVINFVCLSVFPAFLYILHCFDIIGIGVAQLFTLVFLVVFVIFPLIYKFSYSMQRSSIFLIQSSVAHPDYVHPSAYGLAPARNFRLTSPDGVLIGVWHILPDNMMSVVNTTDEQEPYPDNVINNGQDVVIYCHGNAGNRLEDYRIDMYKVLRGFFHVITFDYRSYGDSSSEEPTERKVIEDAVFIYSWFSNKTKSNVFLWGHSLGTSIAIQTVVEVQDRGIKRPAGVILEAPFNNMKDEIGEFSIAKVFKYLPWFSFTVLQPMLDNGFRFESDQFICHINSPIQILHAEDDNVVPYKLGRKLYEAAQICRLPTQGSVSFRTFDGRYRYNHRYICKAPELPEVIRKFVREAVVESRRIA